MYKCLVSMYLAFTIHKQHPDISTQHPLMTSTFKFKVPATFRNVNQICTTCLLPEVRQQLTENLKT
jgi:hypothetical protein